MSRSFHTRRPKFTMEALEPRRLMAADLRLGGAASLPELAEKQPDAYVSTPTAAADKGAMVDQSSLNRFDDPAAADRLFEQIGVEDLLAQIGGLVQRPEAYDKLDDVGGGRGPVGGDVPTIDGLGHADLAGANAQDNAKHTTPQPSAANASERVKAGYEQGGLDVTDKSAYQVTHACVSLDPGAYQAKPQEEGSSNMPSNPAFGGQTNHGGGGSTGGQGQNNNDSDKNDSSKQSDDKQDERKDKTNGSGNSAQQNDDEDDDDQSAEPQGQGGGGDADDEADGDGSGDGDGAGDTPPAEPAAGEPDYGEGYVDPNDPIMQLARDFTDAYFWSTFWATQNGNVTPNPNGDYSASVAYTPRDAKSWVDAPAFVAAEVPSESPGNPDDGVIDPVDQ